jgi:hypothetical protein
MPTPILVPYGPFQPLGLITVAAAGTPVPLTQNIGTYYAAEGKSEYAMQFDKIMVFAPTTNTGLIFMVLPGQPATNTDAIIWQLAPGTSFIFDSDSPARNMFGLNSFWIDAATSGNTAQVTGVVGG